MIGMSTLGASALGGLSSRAVGAQSSTVAVDTSLFGLHGHYIGTPTLGVTGLLDGDPDKASSFPTSADYVRVGDSGALSFTTNVFTIEFWYRDDSASSTAGILSKQGAAYEYAVYRSGTNLEFRAWTSAGLVVYSTTYGPVGTAKHHYVWSCTGFFAILYVDGALVSTTAKTLNSMQDTTEPLLLASGIANPAEAAEVEFDTVTVGLTESVTRLFVAISTGDSIGVGFSESSSVIATNLGGGSTAPLVQINTGDTLRIVCVEPEDLVNEVVSAESMQLGLTESSTKTEVTGGVRTDIQRITQLSPAAIPGKRYRSAATRTISRITRLSPASCPGRA